MRHSIQFFTVEIINFNPLDASQTFTDVSTMSVFSE